ncbi:GL21446 [Drosophila persimilis]|uniref:GL21446 n=1 Tax=Drosophila persimilis TaxID=7234 RepID=B4IRF0_DROPE|nr:GL21446 [Drosophila persimilis]
MKHQNVDATIAEIRTRFWITKLRRVLRKTISACNVCKLHRARAAPPIMGPPAEGLPMAGHLRIPDWIVACVQSEGGVWERMVQCVKKVLRYTLKEIAPKDDVLVSFLIEVPSPTCRWMQTKKPP